jgi:GTP-binding protein
VTVPKVAILGAPNVGKSTLFNRLLGRRRTITDSTPGVTRDPVSARCEFGGTCFELIDTGGYQARSGDDLSDIVSDRSFDSGRRADLILLVVDVTGIGSQDTHFIEKMRPFSDKIILVANKADNTERDGLVWNLYALGFKRIVGVSAAHGRNIDALKTEMRSFLEAVESTEIQEEDAAVKIAILGKPNTGKSTLLNYLLGEQRSIVSEKPGTTRDVIEGSFSHRGKSFVILDTAGIRRKGKVRDAVERYSVSRAIASIRECDVAFLLIDALSGLSLQDKKIASLIEREGKAVVLVINKWDLVEDVPNRLQAMEDRIHFLFPSLGFAPLKAVSAATGRGVEALLRESIRLKQQLERRVDTSDLNRALAGWIEETPPKDRVKIRYATQVSTDPLVFVFFANRPDRLLDNYKRFLANRIRSELGFDSVPLRVEIRKA